MRINTRCVKFYLVIQEQNRPLTRHMSKQPKDVTRTTALRSLAQLKRDVILFSTDTANRSARLRYLEHVHEGVRHGTLADNSQIAPRHRTYGGIVKWVVRSSTGLQVDAYNRIIQASKSLV